MRAEGEGSQRSPMTPSPARMYPNGSSSASGGSSNSNNNNNPSAGLVGGGASLSPIHSPTFAKVANGSNAVSGSAQFTRSENGGNNGSPTSPSIPSNTNGHGYAQPRPTAPYFGHSREEVARVLIQGLTDLGYHSSARSLSRESGYALEGSEVAAFRSAVLRGEWRKAEELLFGSGTIEEGGGVGIGDGGSRSGLKGSEYGKAAVGNGSGVGHNDGSDTTIGSSGLTLAENANKNEMLFWMRQQKYLELLEARDLGEALGVLRGELTPLHRDQGRLHALSRYVHSSMLLEIPEREELLPLDCFDLKC
jgi:WD repeat-containing protein 26